MKKIGPPPRPKRFGFVTVPGFGAKMLIIGPIRFGIMKRATKRFGIKSPIISDRGIKFGGVLIDVGRRSFWIYVPALRVDPKRSIYRIPKGKR